MSSSPSPSPSPIIKAPNLFHRIAVLSDAPRITELVNKMFRSDESKTGWTSEASILGGIRTTLPQVIEILEDEKITFFVLFEDKSENKLLGTVNLHDEGNHCGYLGMLTVDTFYQCGGLGKYLIDVVEKKAIEKGMTTLSMTVISCMSALLQYYERRGFKWTGETAPFPTDEEKFGVPKIDRKLLEFKVLRKSLVTGEGEGKEKNSEENKPSAHKDKENVTDK